MDSPSPPPVPDPAKTAAVQATYNSQAAQEAAALSRYNQVTPYGSLNWSNGKTFDQAGYDKAMAAYQAKVPAGGGGTNPQQLPGDNGVNTDGEWQAANGDGGGGTGGLVAPNKDDFYSGSDNWTSTVTLDPRVQNLVDSYLKTSQGLQGATQGALDNVNSVFAKPIDYSALPAAGSAVGSLAAAKTGYTDISPAVSGALALARQGQGLAGQAGAEWAANMKPLSFDGVAPMWQPNDATRQNVQDNLYSQYTHDLDPQYQQEEAALRSSLMNRGIVEGSQAYEQAMGDFQRQKSNAYNQAQTSSITGATGQMQALFDQGLKARQEGTTEATNLWEAPQTQAANAMGFSTGAGGELGGLTGAQAGQQNSIYNNANTAFNMQNTERQNSLTEQEQQRAMALQWLASLRTGSQPQMPTFQAPNGPNVQPSNYSADAYNSFGGQMQQYNSQVGSQNALMGMLGQLGGAAFMAPVGTFSDRRLKTNVQRVGALSDGTPWYTFDYIWGEPSSGVMADEAPARAVLQHPSGFLMVDYSKLEY